MELKIALAVLSIVSALITGLLIPFLKSKIDKDKRDRLMDMVEIAVKAAEQIYAVKFPKGKMGEEKKQYVVDFLRDKGIKIDEQELTVLIESAVRELNLWQEEIKGA